MTAAAPDSNADDDDNQYGDHSSTSADDNSAITPEFLQQWDEFYHNFFVFVHSCGASNTSTTKDNDTSMTAVSPVANNPATTLTFPSTFDDMHQALHQPISPSSAIHP